MGFSKIPPALLAIALAAAALTLRAGPASALPEPSPVTPGLVEAAKKEGKISFYTSVDIEVAEKLAGSFKAKYPSPTTRST
jgi:iron(III) transport system substrate-binding protein